MDRLLEFLRAPGRLILCMLLVWFIVAKTVYAIRHPDMTSTRQFLNTWDALMFRE